MLWTLWRSISFEFWRLLLLTVAVVVAAIAFAVTVKPLADGMLSADQAIRFMFYAVPPMLAYALPFAAGFAATISIHRMTSENEVTAVYASGISHKKFLFPSLVSGILLAGMLIALNDRVIPRFLKEMERMVTQDFARVFVSSLQSGESATIGSNEIHADIVQRHPPEPGSPVIDQYMLGGVALVKADENGTVTIDGTARRAWIQIRPVWSLSEEDQQRIGDEDATAVLMKFIDLTINREGSPITVDPFTLPAFPIPRVFKDDPKFMSGQEMRDLRDNPDQMLSVDSKRVELAKGIASIRAFRAVADQARQGRAIEMRSPSVGAVNILAGGFTSTDGNWSLLPSPATERIEIEIITPAGTTDRLRAASATLRPERARTDDPLQAQAANRPVLSFSLDLSGVEVLGSSASDPLTTEKAATQYTGLRFRDDPLDALLAHDSEELLEVSRAYTNPASVQYAEFLVPPAQRLDEEIEELRREILSKAHERHAMTAAALVMVLAGSVIALRLKEAQPLVVYLWSFFPALGTIIIISSGQEAVDDSGAPAIPFIYLGPAILLAYTWIAYRRVSRH